MFKNIKAKVIMLITVIIMLVLSGCGQLNMSVDFDPDSQGRHEIKVQLITIENIYADVFFDDVKAYLIEQGFTVVDEVKKGEGNGILTYSVSKKSTDLDYDLQVLAGMANFLPSDEIIKVDASYQDKHGLFFNKQELKIEVPLAQLSFTGLLSGMNEEQRANINAIIEGFDTETDYDLYSGDDWIAVVNQVARERAGILFSAVMKEDGFKTNNAVFAEEEAQVELNRPVWQMSPLFNEELNLKLVEPKGIESASGAVFNNKVHAVRETPNVVGISLVSILAGALVVFVIVKFGIMSKSKKKDKKDEFDDGEVKKDKEIKDEYIDFN